ncbi:MAG: helix-turn-helix domain-containing protein [Faecalibacterium sp.]|jgi:hypothetical protein|nr:helix-turn-helix domain-containing protein [Faecalibacterium sp.]
MDGKLALSVPEMAKALGIGIENAYDLCKRADFPAIRIRGRIIIPADGLKNWLSGETVKPHE